MTMEYMDQPDEQEPQEPQSDKDRNFENLRKKAEAAEAELKELRPLRVRESIREAGWDPDSDQGKAITNAIKLRQAEGAEVSYEPDAIQELAANEYGYTPKASLTPEEQSRQDSTNRIGAIRSSSDTDVEPSAEDDIAQAEADGDWGRAGMLKLNKFVQEQAQ